MSESYSTLYQSAQAAAKRAEALPDWMHPSKPPRPKPPRCDCGRFLSPWGPPDQTCERCRIRAMDERHEAERWKRQNERLDALIASWDAEEREKA